MLGKGVVDVLLASPKGCGALSHGLRGVAL